MSSTICYFLNEKKSIVMIIKQKVLILQKLFGIDFFSKKNVDLKIYTTLDLCIKSNTDFFLRH